MAKEGRVRKVSPHDWPGFLRRVIPAAVWQAFLGRVIASSDPRLRWTPKYVLLCWIAMGWSVQRHLNDRFGEGRQLLTALFAHRRRVGASYWGLVKATQRLGVEGFQRFWAAQWPALSARVVN